MSVNVVLIENNQDVCDDLIIAFANLEKDYISELTEKTKNPKLASQIGKNFYRIKTVTSINDLVSPIKATSSDAQRKAYLDIKNADIILSDVRMTENENIKSSSLEKIVRIVEDIKRTEGLYRIPIIAWTNFPGDARTILKEYLPKDGLTAIWDKSTAVSEYVSWRIEQMANNLFRNRPSMTLQKVIKESNPDFAPHWHEDVLRQIENYSKSENESELIESMRSSILSIGTKLGMGERGLSFWKEIMEPWEMLERAAIHTVRGHARHVINVYWIGYYLLNNPDLEPIFYKPKLRYNSRRRPYWPELKSRKQHHQLLNKAWFISGIFHDIGNCVSKSSKLLEKLDSIYSQFNNVIPVRINSKSEFNSSQTAKHFAELLACYGNNVNAKAAIESLWDESRKNNTPDSGITGALLVLDAISGEKVNDAAKLAAEAIAVHNIVGRDKIKEDMFNWNDDPITCLLVLCDQIQTWDRERGDEDDTQKFIPWQAELLSLKIEKRGEKKKPRVIIAVNYITSDVVSAVSRLTRKTEEDLENILIKNPISALKKLEINCPFKIAIQFHINMEPLGVNYKN